jgi:hypothetical protein
MEAIFSHDMPLFTPQDCTTADGEGSSEVRGTTTLHPVIDAVVLVLPTKALTAFLGWKNFSNAPSWPSIPVGLLLLLMVLPTAFLCSVCLAELVLT